MTRIIIFLLLLSNSVFAQGVLKLEEGQAPIKATIEEISWLTGYWEGTGFGGECTEMWLPPVDGAMQGVFRYAKDGKLIFSEYMHVVSQEGSLAIKLKHYNGDLTVWEEKENWVEFKLVKIEGTTAWFHGLTYHREGDELTILLSLKSKEKSWVESFKFKKSTI